MSRLALLAGGGAAAAVVAVVAVVVSTQSRPAPDEPSSEIATESVAPRFAPEPEIVFETEPETAETEGPSSLPPLVSPKIDVVRVEPSGQTLVAGQAMTGTRVSILIDGAALGEAVPGNDGKFAGFIEVTPSDQPQVVSLMMHRGNEEIASAGNVIIAPQPIPAIEVAQEPQRDDTQPQTEMAQAPAVEDSEASPDQTRETPSDAPTVLATDETGVRVLQSPEVLDTIALDTISYDAQGDVALAGRASAEFVRVYLDNKPISSSRIEADGSWRTDLPQVDRGIYTLRVDEVDADGVVTSRVETPFKREDRADLVAVDAGSSDLLARVITVQPGNTLWAIARERYGEGTLYVRLFEANRDRIRDPDLIYPGQVFDIPE